jgi:hypothetical protein
MYTLTYLRCKKYSYQKLTEFSQGSHVLDVPPTNTDGFLSRDTCFFNSAVKVFLEQRDPNTILINLSCRKYSYQKLTQFSHENNVLGAPASNTGDYLLTDTCDSST